MENKMDEFFKKNLEGHTVAPSEEAWAKVEATLSKKNNVAVWRIAAAVLITGALISVILWSQRGVDKNQPENLANQSAKKKLSSPDDVQTQSKIKPSPEAQKSLSTNPTSKIKSQKKLQSRKTTPSQSLPTENKRDENKNQPVEVLPAETQPVVTQVTADADKKNIIVNEHATLATANASKPQKPIKLEFTLEDFSSEQPVATVNDEKSTKLQKVWELAREVKNGEGPVREMKNELFAFSFRRNKNQ